MPVFYTIAARPNLPWYLALARWFQRDYAITRFHFSLIRPTIAKKIRGAGESLASRISGDPQ